MIYTYTIALLVGLVFAAYVYGLRSIAPKRLYKSGTGWCVWRWTTVPSDYIRRLHVIKTPWCALCLHWINGPDPEPWLHDHPVSFLSVILRGGYAEKRERNGKLRLVVHRWFNFARASHEDKHTIMFVRKNTLTLCFMGPKVREWGFHTDAGWIHWKQYNAKTYATLKLADKILREYYTPEKIEALAAQPSPAFAAFGKGKYGDGPYGGPKLVEPVKYDAPEGAKVLASLWCTEMESAFKKSREDDERTLYRGEFDDEAPTEEKPYADFEITGDK